MASGNNIYITFTIFKIKSLAESFEENYGLP